MTFSVLITCLQFNPVTMAGSLGPRDTEERACALYEDTPGQSAGCITYYQCGPVAAMLSQMDLCFLSEFQFHQVNKYLGWL